MLDEQTIDTAEPDAPAADNPVRAQIFAAHDAGRLTVGKLSDLCGKNGIEIPNIPDPVVLIIPERPHHRHPALKPPPPPPGSDGEMQPMFDSAEHTAIGDSIELKIPNPQGGGAMIVQAGSYPLSLPNGLRLTFGQILALAGDFFGYIVNGEAQEISDDQHPPTVFNNSFNSLATASSAVSEVSKILQVMQTEINALNKAATSGQQPSTAYDDLSLDGQYNVATGGGSSVTDYYPEGPYLILAARNWDHFGQDAITAYTTGHGAALQQALTARGASSSSAQLSGLQLAYAMDAFACHFLSDLFASGHMRTPRRQLYSYVTGAIEPGDIGSLLAKYMHDEDNRFGLLVQDAAAAKWKAFGDSRYYDTVDTNNRSLVNSAVGSSANEIWVAFYGGSSPSVSNYVAPKIVANLSQFNNHNDHNNPPPLFYYSGSTGYCREELFDLTNYDWTTWWVGATTLGEIAAGPDYSDYTPPLNTITPPTTSVGSHITWTQNTPYGPNWVNGSRVRYAVSFFDQNTGNESELGPWSGWADITSHCCPTLSDIPTCAHPPSGMNIGRKLYHQFQNSHGQNTTIQLAITIADNTTTTATDTTQ